jgi:hypothetical protein
MAKKFQKWFLWFWTFAGVPIVSALLVDIYYQFNISYIYNHYGLFDGILLISGLVTLEIFLKVGVWLRVIWGAVYLLLMAVVIEFFSLLVACSWGDGL